MRTISWEAGYSVLHHTFYLLNSIYKYGFMDFSLFTRNVKHTHIRIFLVAAFRKHKETEKIGFVGLC